MGKRTRKIGSSTEIVNSPKGFSLPSMAKSKIQERKADRMLQLDAKLPPEERKGISSITNKGEIFNSISGQEKD